MSTAAIIFNISSPLLVYRCSISFVASFVVALPFQKNSSWISNVIATKIVVGHA